MRKIFSMPIRAQLFLMTCIVALPAVGIFIASGIEQRLTAMQEARTETQKLADAILSQQEALVASSEQLVSALAQLPDIRNHNAAKAQVILRDILKLNPQYLNIFIADRAGTMWVSAVPMKARFSVTDRRYFTKARDSGHFSSGEYILGRIFGRPTISFGYPIRSSNGEFDGVIAVNFDLDYNRDLLLRSKLPPGSGYILIDHDGVILSTGRSPLKIVGQRDIPQLFQTMVKGPDGNTFIGTGFDGARRFMTYRALRIQGEETPYLYIRTSIPVGMAVSHANAILVRNLALFSPFLLFAFFVAWIIGKRSIVDRVATLETASQRLAAGDFQARVADLVTGGDLGRLAQSFDAMAREIDARDRALRTSEEHYRLLIDNSPNMVMIHCNGRITFINPAGVRMLGAADASQILGRSVLDFVHDDYHRVVAQRLQLLKTQTQALPRIEEKYLRLDGSAFDVDVAAIPLTISGEQSVEVIVRDISERRQTEEKIRAALAEKVVLLQEIHHRTKNNLQIIAGLLELQAQLLDDRQYREILTASQNRINALALLYDRLYQSQNLTHIDLCGYVKNLCCDLLSTCHEEQRTFNFNFDFPADRIVIDIDAAVPCGLIVNELVSNAISHAFSGTDPAGNVIDIVLRQDETETVVLTVGDNGRGLPQGMDLSDVKTLGMRLVKILTRQLGGDLTVDTAGGTTYRISFKAHPVNSGPAGRYQNASPRASEAGA